MGGKSTLEERISIKEINTSEIFSPVSDYSCRLTDRTGLARLFSEHSSPPYFKPTYFKLKVMICIRLFCIASK